MCESVKTNQVARKVFLGDVLWKKIIDAGLEI